MNKSEFKKAVADNEAPTPGYLYRDMASWTFVDYATQLQLIKALFDKLQTKSSTFVLYKALHLIKVLCETGQEGFQKELQLGKYTNVVKNFTTYRGPLDARYGDSWNEKVRREAQAALDAIFQTRLTTSSSFSAVAPMAIGGGGGNGDWSGTGSSAVEEGMGKGPWGSSGNNDNLVMPSFATPNPYSSGNSAGLQQGGGLPAAFDAPSLHIGEMPSENRWAAHQRELAALSPPYGSTSSSSSNTAKPSKSLLQQLASTAKSGMNLMTQFEVLKAKQQRLYGDQFGRAARATAGPDNARGSLSRGRDVDEVGSYQPVGLSVPASSCVGMAEQHTAPPFSIDSVVADPRAGATSSSPSPLLATAPTAVGSHGTSSFAFLSDTTSPGRDPVGVASLSDDAAEDFIHSLARLRQTPSRVELSRLLHLVAESATDAASSPARSYGAQLASALSGHLIREKPWQERLNALVALEALLRGISVPPLREGLADFFTRQPHFVQVNYDVVQVTLKERAGKLAQLLSIPAMPTVASAAPTPVNTAHNDGSNDDPSASSAARTEEKGGLQHSEFKDLFDGGAPTAAAMASPSSVSFPQPSAWSGTDTFEGMTIHNAGGADCVRRTTDASADVTAPAASAKSVGLGGDVASRPQRRTNKAAEVSSATGSNLLAGEDAQGRVGGIAAIQILRSSGGGDSRTPATSATAAQQQPSWRQRASNAEGSNLDSLLGVSPSVSTRPAAVASPTAIASTLDDLFGDSSVPSAPCALPERAKPPNTHTTTHSRGGNSVTADDLFASPPSSSPHAASAAELARIQQLMQYLETQYDPAAMAELEALILRRQQQLQLMAAQQGVAEGVLSGGTAAAMATTTATEAPQSHRQFQLGGTRNEKPGERHHSSSAFADVQAEMKRKMEL